MMTFRSALVVVVFASVAALACSSADAGFSTETQGGSSGSAGHAGGLGAAGNASGQGGATDGDAGMSEGGAATAGADNVSGAAGSAGTAGNAGVSGMSGSAGLGAVGGGGAGGGAGASGGMSGMGGAPPVTFCPAGTLRCTDHDLQSCNASGSAWLYSSTCQNGCSAGSCTGNCTAGIKRCTANNAEVCAATGSSWNVIASCSTFCDPASAACALDGLDVTNNTVLDGDIAIQGTVHVHAGGTLSSPSGNLTLRADAIVVDAAGAIVVAPTGLSPLGKGGNSCNGAFGAGGGAYGGVAPQTPAGQNCNGVSGAVWGLGNDALVFAGSPGGDSNNAVGANGGGVLRLIARNISIAGQITANGASAAGSAGAGSGGGILCAASESLSVSGAVSAAGGAGFNASDLAARGASGGMGRVKLLYGTAVTVTGSVVGTRTDGLLPPLQLGSTTQPDSSLAYNDNFTALELSWNRPFASVQGYYGRLDTAVGTTVTMANGTFGAALESGSVMRQGFVQGANYFHIVPVNAQSAVGAVQSWFKVQLNTLPPTLSSSSHPSQTAWTASQNPFFSWVLPVGVSAQSVRSFYYVLDHQGSSVPSKADNTLASVQQSILLSGLDNGVWMFHLISADTRGNTTRAAAHYQLRIGPDPGSTSLFGKVTTGATATALAGVAVTLNNGLFGTVITDANGNYSLTAVPAGSYTLTTSKTGFTASTQPVTLQKNVIAQANVTLN